MKYTVLFFSILFLFSCAEKKQSVTDEVIVNKLSSLSTEKKEITDESQKPDPALSKTKSFDVKEFIPEGFILFEEIQGDLNKDGIDDYVLVIKGTDEENIVEDEYRGSLDRNRRGIIIVLNAGEYFERVVANYDCFSSENEDGGVYFAPELWMEITRGVLIIGYSHGRYGSWKYTFRYQNGTFELIGYDSYSCRGPIGLSKTSVNFSTKKQKTSVNVNANSYDEDTAEEWEDTWDDIEIDSLFDLNYITDFDSIHF